MYAGPEITENGSISAYSSIITGPFFELIYIFCKSGIIALFEIRISKFFDKYLNCFLILLFLFSTLN